MCLYIRGRGEGLVFPRQPGDSGRPPSLDFESANSAAFPTNWPQAEMEKWNNRRVWSPAKLRFQINCFVAGFWEPTLLGWIYHWTSTRFKLSSFTCRDGKCVKKCQVGNLSPKNVYVVAGAVWNLDFRCLGRVLIGASSSDGFSPAGLSFLA